LDTWHSLDFGLIGEVYEDKTLEIILTVIPRNLSNCEEWRIRVELHENQREHFEAYCRIEVDEAPADAAKEEDHQ
jgi:hypothetical protein